MVVVLNFFGNFVGLVAVVLAARAEAVKQRRLLADNAAPRVAEGLSSTAGAHVGRREEPGSGGAAGDSGGVHSRILTNGSTVLVTPDTAVGVWDGGDHADLNRTARTETLC